MDIPDLVDLEEVRPADMTQDARALLKYALNILKALEPASDEAGELVTWLAGNHERLGLPGGLFIPQDTCRRSGRDSAIPPIGKQRWHDIGHALSERLRPPPEAVDRLAVPATQNESHAVEAGLRAVSVALGFDELDAALFEIIFRYGMDNIFERLFDGLARVRGRTGSLRLYPDLFALLIGAPQRQVGERFRADSPLVASGAIQIDEDGDIHLPGRLRGLIIACGETGCDIRRELLGKPVKANLPWNSFRHLGREIEVARAVLAQALAAMGDAEPECGVHILLYGPPGTGKTECAASLAAELGVELHAIGEQSESRREPSRAERLSSLLLAQRISGNTPALYLFDEAEDLFRSRGRGHESDPKIFVHRLLETARVPMIWAANDLNAFSPAVLRRMSMCIEVKLPDASRRAELWRELAESERVALDAPTAERLARMIPSAPSVARTALRATRLAGGDAATAELVARGMAKAIAHGAMPSPEPVRPEEVYDPALSRADIDLADIASRLTREGAPLAISLLLSGPSGTGKSAFARYLAGRMGLKVLAKNGSDIFDKYVGGTEQNIAAAFAEARAERKFLIFDEVDSLLAGRGRAEHGWEVSQVNEMLTWMESHPLPFACTTNLPDALDKASLRRFLIRANFDYLTPEQTARLFRTMFGAEPPTRLAALDRLVPADFTRIARRNAALGEHPTPEALFALLEAEAVGRIGGTRAIGFRTLR